MSQNYKNCEAVMKEVSALAQAAGVISWDQETMMPRKGAVARSEQLSAISGVIHDKFTDPKTGKLLRALKASAGKLTANEKVCVGEWMHDYEKSVKLPSELIRELARVESLSQDAWIRARKRSDFSIFAPWLEKVIKLKRRQAEYIGYKNSPYDALLDDYEPGVTSAMIDPLFESVRKRLVRIVKDICSSKQKIDKRILTRSYPSGEQETLCREVMAAIGVDPNATRLDTSAHPFCCGIAPGDVRITTRYNEKYLPQALYGVMHESGHALYEQGLPEKHMGTPLAEAVSLGIHESQSRMWENLIGRSQPFVSFIYPLLKKRFSKQLARTHKDEFYRAINDVSPSLIRIEADEVTYNLHIILRYEIEKAFIEGTIKVKDLPAIWNEKMKKYLGIAPKNDAEGVLQDTHWASGLIGYFPTYLLGNLYAAQFWATIKKDIKNVDKKISSGQFAPILAWLRGNIHEHGRRYHAPELIKRATGESLNADHFIDYLYAKFLPHQSR